MIVGEVFYHKVAAILFISVQQKTEDLSMYLKLLSFLDTPALIVAAAAANDASTVRDFLSRKPQDVR